MRVERAANPRVRVVRDADAAGVVVADMVRQAALAAVAARGQFTLAIPGGSSPRTVLGQLARDRAFPWERTHVLWVDERAVATDHSQSNYGAFARDVLPLIRIDPARVHRMRGELGSREGAVDYRRTLRRTLGLPKADGCVLDAVLLGVGEDGHVASLFPGSPSLAATELVTGITDSPKPPPERITLTVPVFLSARLLVVLGLGESKADAVARSLAGEPLPAEVCSRGTNAVWVIDEAAGRGRRPQGDTGRDVRG